MRPVLTLFLVALMASQAFAGASPGAEALFREGKKLMKDGKLAEACTAFEGSERTEHSLVTLMNLADCREKNRQYATAWALFLQVESQTRSDATKTSLNTTAKARSRALEPKLSYLTINVPDESRIPDLIVMRDGIAVDLAEWNRSIPLDGGTHEIAGKAPGHESWSTKITLGAEADKQAVEVPKFKALPLIVNAHHNRRVVPAPSALTARRKIGIAAVGLGALVGAGSVYFGVRARSLRGDALALCPPTDCTVEDAASAQDRNDRARNDALYANIGFGIAGAAAAAGIVLWVTGKPEVTVAPQVGSVNGVAITGGF